MLQFWEIHSTPDKRNPSLQIRKTAGPRVAPECGDVRSKAALLTLTVWITRIEDQGYLHAIPATILKSRVECSSK